MKITDETRERFLSEIQKYEKKEESSFIGTMNEKMLHSVLKSTVAGDTGECEVRIDGHNIADCIKDNTVYEIQTESLFPVRKKIDFFLGETCFDIDIVFPIPRKRYTLWVNTESGDVIRPARGSNAKTLIDKIDEIRYLLPYIDEERVTLTVVYIEEEEWRRLDGKRSKDRKRGSTRIERRPLQIISGEEIRSARDLEFLLPVNDEFTKPEYKKEKKIRSERRLFAALDILQKLGYIKKEGKRGNAFLYKRINGGKSE